MPQKFIDGELVDQTVSVAFQGTGLDAAYDDSDDAADAGTVISLLKAIYLQQVAQTALLTDIETNTDPA